MPAILKKALTLLTGTPLEAKALTMPKKSNHLSKQITERQLIQLESEIGGTLFGAVPKGGDRKFFNLDETTWIWHEGWVDDRGKKRESTTRYEIQGDKILKVREGARYNYLEGEELSNLLTAISLYYEQVMRGIYKIDPATGQPQQ